MTILAVALSIGLVVGGLTVAHWIDAWMRRKHDGKWPR